jgi:CheY-like chemotaxis protein
VGVHNPQRFGELPSGLPGLEVVNILVIDDSKVQRKLAAHVLSGPLGCEVWNVKGFESGEHALRYITSLEKRPDVLMVDQNLRSAGGRLNGNELVAHVIGKGWKEDTVIIGITSEGQDARDAFVKAGCHIVWTKPMPEKYEIQAAIYGIQQNRQRAKKAALLANEAQGHNTPVTKEDKPTTKEDRDTTTAFNEMSNALATGLSTS